MVLRDVEGNLLDLQIEVIGHGVACAKIEDMKTGLSDQIRKKWPDSYERFKKLRKIHSYKGGEVILDEENTPQIAYLATQENLMYADYTFLNRSLRALDKLLIEKEIKACALPHIGCGYGKLEWEQVKQVISERLSESPIDYLIVTYKS